MQADSVLLLNGLLLLRRPFRRRGGNGNRQRVQFVAGQLRLQAVFDQAVAGEAGFAFKLGRDDDGEEVMSVAFDFDVFAKKKRGVIKCVWGLRSGPFFNLHNVELPLNIVPPPSASTCSQAATPSISDLTCSGVSICIPCFKNIAALYRIMPLNIANLLKMVSET